KAAAEAAKAAAAAAKSSAVATPPAATAPAAAALTKPAAKGSVEQLACPACGAPLDARAVDTADTLACAYCGATIRVKRTPKAAAAADEAPKPTTVTDPATGKPLATVCLPAGWKITKAALDATNPTNDFPFAPTFEAANDRGAVIRYHSGEKYVQFDRWLATQVSQFNPKVKQRPFATVEEFLDSFAARYANAQVSVHFVGQCPLPQHDPVTPEEGRRGVLNRVLAEANSADTYGNEPMKPAAIYFDSACRIYDVAMNGKVVFRMAVATFLEGAMCTANLPMPGLAGLGSLLGGLFGGSGSGSSGGLLGALFGGGAANPAPSPAPAATPAAAAGGADSRFFAYSMQTGALTPTTRQAFCAVSGYGALSWMARNIFTLLAPVDSFDGELAGAFKDVCSGVKLSDYVYSRWERAAEQEAQALRQKTQLTLQQQQAQFEAAQAFNRAQQAAFDSYHQAWWDRENATWAANRARDRAAAASADRVSSSWSEAIRGVNTYVRPDGSEVEVSVAADTAWTNASGDVLGGSVTFNPGSDWTQMERKM
ncbi:MAG: hypothetical protein IKD70_02690, partial [Eggerthellaceae bacterium]|nr:hypothetical protein [Eggerthellaceae bacterium]